MQSFRTSFKIAEVPPVATLILINIRLQNTYVTIVMIVATSYDETPLNSAKDLPSYIKLGSAQAIVSHIIYLLEHFTRQSTHP